MIPSNYTAWHTCITQWCGIVLTLSYIDTRIEQLSDDSNTNTLEFIKRYGNEHRLRVLEWFRMAKMNL